MKLDKIETATRKNMTNKKLGSLIQSGSNLANPIWQSGEMLNLAQSGIEQSGQSGRHHTVEKTGSMPIWQPSQSGKRCVRLPKKRIGPDWQWPIWQSGNLGQY